MLLKCKEVSEAYSSWKASVFSLGFKNHVDDQFSIIWFCVFSVYMYVPATTQSDLCMCCTAGHIQFFLGSDSGCWSYGYDRVSREVSSPTVLWIEFRSDDVTKNAFAEIVVFIQLFRTICLKKLSLTKHWLFSALSSWDMGVWSSHCSIVNSLI